MTKKIITFLSDIRLGLICLTGLFIITFWGTIDQVNLGIFQTQKKYFQSLFIYINITDSLKLPVFPGGFLLGSVFTINLFFAMLRYHLFDRKKWGLTLIHIGLIVLMIGSALTSSLGIESQLAIKEGESKNYTEDHQHVEWVIVDANYPDKKMVYSIPESKLKENRFIKDQSLPFKAKVLTFLKNSDVSVKTDKHTLSQYPTPTLGLGHKFHVKEKDPVTIDTEANMSTAYIDIYDTNDTNIGTLMLSRSLANAQSIEVNGKTYHVQLRAARYYMPYTLTLKDFSFDRYEGTEIPKNFSSKVTIDHPQKKEHRDALIYMNHPLRYEGRTYYQASFGDNETLSVLQVVENPAWLFPYISCLLISIGMTAHFLIRLKTAQSKRRQK